MPWSSESPVSVCLIGGTPSTDTLRLAASCPDLRHHRSTGSGRCAVSVLTRSLRMKRKTTPSRGPLDRMARASLRESGSSMLRLEHSCAAAVAAAAEAAITCLQNGGTLYFCGNGGSAADAQHLACELSRRFFFDRPALAPGALT